jgi:cardiolipin synthase
MHWPTIWETVWFFTIEGALRIALAMHVILRRRPVTTSLAWLSIILFVPIAGLVFYFLIGEIRLGSRRAKKYEQLTKGLEENALKTLSQRRLTARHVPEEYDSISRFGTAVTGLPPLRGNALRLFGDNVSMLEALKADIDAAKLHIHLCYYIYNPDSAGVAIANALAEAVKRGVAVRLLVDGGGSRCLLRHDLCKQMRAAGVQVVEALPTHLWRMAFRRLDLRNHRKIAVFDGRIAYCGSQNIIDVGYKSPRWKKAGRWIDATVRVVGPAAQELAVTFLRDWQLDSDENITSCDPFLPEPEPASDEAGNSAAVQLIASGPGPTPQAIHQAVLTAIYSARKEIILTTPYFVPDAALLEALMAAAMRQVRVVLVLPDVSDAPLVAAAGRAHYQELLESGVEIYEYLGGLLHSKIMTMDGAFAMIGSTNMDQRSFFLNFEATLFVYDQLFASESRKLQTDYMSRSQKLRPEDWRDRSILVRLRDNSAQLLGPLL